MKYRKKPIVVEAIQYQWPDSDRGAMMVAQDDVADFMSQNIVITSDCIEIETLEGVMTAQRGDWIIKGVKGEFYPCKPDIFEATYVEDSE